MSEEKQIVKRSNKKKTHEQYVDEVKIKNPNVTVIGTYINATTKIAHKCNLCGNEWDTTPNNILHGHWCKSCSLKEIFKIRPKTQPKLRKSHQQYVKELYQANPNIEILDTYITTENKNHFHCKICGYEWYAKPSYYLYGKGCWKCGKQKSAETRSYSHDEFVEKLSQINNSIEVRGKYINSKTKIACRCKIDNYEFDVFPSQLLAGHGCLECYKRSVVLDEEDFFTRAKEMCPTIKILTQYTKATDRYLCECINCKYQWFANGSNILRGQAGCKECDKKSRRLTHQEFLVKLNKITPDIVPLDEYCNACTKIRFLCKVCGCHWETSPVSVLNGHGCLECYKRKLRSPKKSHMQFVEQVRMCNPNITILEKYTGAKNKISCKCDICSFEWQPYASSVLSGYRCPKCAGFYKTTDEFKEEIYRINPDIEILSKYIDAKTKIECKCKICGNVWEVIANNLRYTGCPRCNESSGERQIRQILDEHSVVFVRNKTFDDLRGIKGKYLSYDFYLSEYNLLIEFQGKQHIKPVEFFGGEEKFKIQQEHDQRKRKYAKQNNINLLEIWYYDIDNIESILLQKINEIKEKII